jgi:hypothetical protein
MGRQSELIQNTRPLAGLREIFWQIAREMPNAKPREVVREADRRGLISEFIKRSRWEQSLAEVARDVMKMPDPVTKLPRMVPNDDTEDPQWKLWQNLDLPEMVAHLNRKGNRIYADVDQLRREEDDAVRRFGREAIPHITFSEV